MAAADRTSQPPSVRRQPFGAEQTEMLPTRSPIFIAGRQHSGNTVLTDILARVPECLALSKDHGFIEHLPIADRIREPIKRATYAVRQIQLEREGPDLRDNVMRWIADWIGQHPTASATEIYLEAMRRATEVRGRKFWAQKATSYIFYADRLFEAIPDATMLYVVRNPYDICASKKRRDPRLDRLIALMIGWNKGLRIAMELERTRPEQFKIVKYEDLVRAPLVSCEDIFRFLGLDFNPNYTMVRHVNRADQPGHRNYVGTDRGLNQSRVFYYVKELAAGEVAALDLLAPTAELARLYPDLPHLGMRHSPRVRAQSIRLLAAAPGKLLRSQVRHYGHSPALLVDRIIQRLRS